MIKTILVILVSVGIFGILFFLIVKNILKKRIKYYLKRNNKNSN